VVVPINFKYYKRVKPSLINAAIDRSVINQLSFWDSLIVECALIAKCYTLFSEDMHNKQSIEGCQIQNPFDDYSSNNYILFKHNSKYQPSNHNDCLASFWEEKEVSKICAFISDSQNTRNRKPKS